VTVPSEAQARLRRNSLALPGPRDVVGVAVGGDEAVAVAGAVHEGLVGMLLPSRLLMMIMMSVVAVVVVSVVGSMDMTWSCIAVLSELLRGCIEVVPEHRLYIVAGGTVDVDVDGADDGVDGVAGVAGAVLREDVVVVR
jgi:hypothetical protein